MSQVTRPLKFPATVSEHIELLRSRGMEVDEALARQWLSNVSYYRLSGYWYSYRILLEKPDKDDHKRDDNFVPGTSFTDVVNLYEFDRKMRTLIHDGIERIEVALRTQLGEQICFKGSLAYKNPEFFREKFELKEWLETATERIERAAVRNSAIKHYKEKYGEYPFWVLAEILDFSDVSRLYSGLLAKDQHQIAQRLGFQINMNDLRRRQRDKFTNNHPLARWFEQLTVIRNTCAHHARLWNGNFTPVSTTALRTIKDLSTLPKGQSERLYGSLLVMAFLMRTISPNGSWARKVTALVENSYEKIPGRSLGEMGFPDNWQANTIWE